MALILCYVRLLFFGIDIKFVTFISQIKSNLLIHKGHQLATNNAKIKTVKSIKTVGLSYVRFGAGNDTRQVSVTSPHLFTRYVHN